MKKTWSNKWKKCLIWFSGYFSFIAFAVVGGYAVIKGEDEELKKTAKTAFVVTLIFAAISAFLTIFYNFASLSPNYYGGGAQSFYQILSAIVAVARIIVFAVFVIIELAKNDGAKVEQAKQEETTAQATEAEVVEADTVEVEAEVLEEIEE